MADTINLNVVLPGLGMLSVGETHHVLKRLHFDHTRPSS